MSNLKMRAQDRANLSRTHSSAEGRAHYLYSFYVFTDKNCNFAKDTEANMQPALEQVGLATFKNLVNKVFLVCALCCQELHKPDTPYVRFSIESVAHLSTIWKNARKRTKLLKMNDKKICKILKGLAQRHKRLLKACKIPLQ